MLLFQWFFACYITIVNRCVWVTSSPSPSSLRCFYVCLHCALPPHLVCRSSLAYAPVRMYVCLLVCMYVAAMVAGSRQEQRRVEGYRSFRPLLLCWVPRPIAAMAQRSQGPARSKVDIVLGPATHSVNGRSVP